MHGILLLRLSAVTAYFLVNARELAASELLLQQSPLDKTIEEIGDTNDTDGEDEDMEEQLQKYAWEKKSTII